MWFSRFYSRLVILCEYFSLDIVTDICVHFLLFTVLANPVPIEDEPEAIAVPDKLEPDWQLVPDGDGAMHLVDVNDQPIEPLFNAWNDVFIRVVTNNNRNNPIHIILNNAASLHNSPFNPSHPTRIIIHGWNNNGQSAINNMMRNDYLNLGNFNVLIVDWGLGANTINYLAAQGRIPDVGHYVAQFMDWVHRSTGAAFASMTCVGHSLGAHTCGIVGKRVQAGRLQNIVALDPAFPLFTMGNTANRVTPNDANYVETIQTDTGRLGFDQPLGDASFYPNWGRGMPGCGIDATGNCGHSRAWEFMGESIRTPSSNFWATRCAAYANIVNRSCPPSGASQQMGGEPLTRAANGVYFLVTNANPPFAQGFRN